MSDDCPTRNLLIRSSNCPSFRLSSSNYWISLAVEHLIRVFSLCFRLNFRGVAGGLLSRGVAHVGLPPLSFQFQKCLRWREREVFL